MSLSSSSSYKTKSITFRFNNAHVSVGWKTSSKTNTVKYQGKAPLKVDTSYGHFPSPSPTTPYSLEISIPLCMKWFVFLTNNTLEQISDFGLADKKKTQWSCTQGHEKGESKFTGILCQKGLHYSLNSEKWIVCKQWQFRCHWMEVFIRSYKVKVEAHWHCYEIVQR